MEKNILQIVLPETAELRELRIMIRELTELLEHKKNSLSDLVPAKVISKHFDMTEQTLSKYAEKGEYKKYYKGERGVVYSLREFEDFIKRSVEPNKADSYE